MYFGMIKPLPTRNLINISAAALILLGGFFAFPSFTSAELSLPVTPCDDEQVDAILPTYIVSAHLVPGMIKEPGNVAFQYGADNNSFVSKSGDIITFNVNLLFTPDNPLAIIKLMAFDASCNIIFGFGPAFTELSPDREKVVTFDTATNIVAHEGNEQQLFPNFAPRYVWVEVVDQYPNANFKTFSYLIDILDPQNPSGQPDEEPPEPPARNPVIIVPGILGSTLFKGDDLIWVSLQIIGPGDEFLDVLLMDEHGNPLDEIRAEDIMRKPFPGSDYYDGLIRGLESKGYQENTDLFVFPYDWRLDIGITAEALKAKIESIIEITGNGKVDIVAHSMGGLVVKDYIDIHGAGMLGKVLLLGTPHIGSPEAAIALLWGKPTPLLASLREMKKLARNMPSVYQLLPSSPYFNFSGYYKINTEILSLDETVQEFTRLDLNTELIARAEVLHSELDDLDLSQLEVYNINGCNTATIGAFRMRPGGLGLPVDIEWLPGDGTVPLRSSNSVLVGSDRSYFVKKVSHDTMMSNESVKELVSGLLLDNFNGNENVLQNRSTCTLRKGKILANYSPVELHITDQEGNSAGPADTDSTENKIPGAQYLVLGEEKFAFLPTDEGQEYSITLKAIESGDFDLKIQNFDEEIVNTMFYHQIEINASSSARFMLSETSDDSQIEFDYEGDGSFVQVSASSILDGTESTDAAPPTTIPSPSGTMGLNGWYRSNVAVKLGATDDNSGVLRTEYSLDGGATWQEYLTPFEITTPGINEVQFFSTDRAGNREENQSIEIKTDKWAPDASFMFDLAARDVIFSGIDDQSGVVVQDLGNQVILTDEAGNTTVLNYKEKTKKQKSIELELTSISYNDKQKIKLPENETTYSWTLDRSGNITRLEQELEIKEKSVSLNYSSKHNETVVTEKIKRGKKKETLSGLVILKVKIMGGKIEYEY